ncbi:MAG: hypothetical protein ACLT98_16960, partial [Eggerthellaceae bacterium]
LMAVVSVTLYGCSAGLCAFRTIRKSDRFPVAARLLFLAAFLLHSVSIGMESVSTSGTILQGPNVLMLASWVLALVSLFVSVASRRPYGYLAIASATVSLFILFSQMILMASGYALYANSAYEQWPSLVVHILLFLVAWRASRWPPHRHAALPASPDGAQRAAVQRACLPSRRSIGGEACPFKFPCSRWGC